MRFGEDRSLLGSNVSSESETQCRRYVGLTTACFATKLGLVASSNERCASSNTSSGCGAASQDHPALSLISNKRQMSSRRQC